MYFPRLKDLRTDADKTQEQIKEYFEHALEFLR